MRAHCQLQSKRRSHAQQGLVLRLDRVLADGKMRSKDLASSIGLSEVNVSRIKTGRATAIRFSTLEALRRATELPRDARRRRP